jgi:hypothetical protein
MSAVASLYVLDGQAVRDDLGTIRIQKPHKGPFYVSPKSIDELIANLGKWSRSVLHLLNNHVLLNCQKNCEQE